MTWKLHVSRLLDSGTQTTQAAGHMVSCGFFLEFFFKGTGIFLAYL